MRRNRPRRPFTVLLIAYVIVVLVLSGMLAAMFYSAMFLFGFGSAFLLGRMGGPLVLLMMVILFACLLSMPLGRSRLRPVDRVISAMEKVAGGDFSVRVPEENLSADMRDLVRSFNAMAEELGSIEMFRTDFINNFSHEFKTPIVSIRGFARQLERDDITEEQRREYASIIASESERLANMSANVLLLSKLENTQIVTDRVEYALDEQLRRCILLLEKQWSGKDIELSLDLNEARYYGNEEMMSHVWVNLIGNAIKFSPQGALLEIGCVRQGDRVRVTVRDHGEGMTEQTRRRIFEKFYQGDTNHAAQGNGLGLSLVKRIVDLCRGTIEVSDTPGGGTTFTVTLPDANR